MKANNNSSKSSSSKSSKNAELLAKQAQKAEETKATEQATSETKPAQDSAPASSETPAPAQEAKKEETPATESKAPEANASETKPEATEDAKKEETAEVSDDFSWAPKDVQEAVSAAIVGKKAGERLTEKNKALKKFGLGIELANSFSYILDRCNAVAEEAKEIEHEDAGKISTALTAFGGALGELRKLAVALPRDVKRVKKSKEERKQEKVASGDAFVVGDFVEFDLSEAPKGEELSKAKAEKNRKIKEAYEGIIPLGGVYKVQNIRGDNAYLASEKEGPVGFVRMTQLRKTAKK